jgi:Flp pilus assembly protein TadD
MKRYLMIGILVVPTALAVSALVYRQSSAGPAISSVDDANARRMWAAVDNSKANEHELKALEDSLKKNPGHVPILVRMAQIHMDLGDKDQAVRRLREAVEAEPKNPQARLELGRALFESGDVHGAIRETNSLLEMDPYDIDGLYNLGAIYANLGQDDRAREYWTKAVSVDPDSESAQRPMNALKQLDK